MFGRKKKSPPVQELDLYQPFIYQGDEYLVMQWQVCLDGYRKTIHIELVAVHPDPGGHCLRGED